MRGDTAAVRPGQTDRATMLRMWRELALHLAHYLDTTPPEKRTTAMLGQIRGFLKDNHCAADAAHKVDHRGRLDSILALGLPFGQSGKDH